MLKSDVIIWNPRVGNSGDDFYTWPSNVPIMLGYRRMYYPTKDVTPDTRYFFDPTIEPHVQQVNNLWGINQIICEANRQMLLSGDHLKIKDSRIDNENKIEGVGIAQGYGKLRSFLLGFDPPRTWEYISRVNQCNCSSIGSMNEQIVTGEYLSYQLPPLEGELQSLEMIARIFNEIIGNGDDYECPGFDYDKNLKNKSITVSEYILRQEICKIRKAMCSEFVPIRKVFYNYTIKAVDTIQDMEKTYYPSTLGKSFPCGKNNLGLVKCCSKSIPKKTLVIKGGMNFGHQIVASKGKIGDWYPFTPELPDKEMDVMIYLGDDADTCYPDFVSTADFMGTYNCGCQSPGRFPYGQTHTHIPIIDYTDNIITPHYIFGLFYMLQNSSWISCSDGAVFLKAGACGSYASTLSSYAIQKEWLSYRVPPSLPNDISAIKLSVNSMVYRSAFNQCSVREFYKPNRSSSIDICITDQPIVQWYKQFEWDRYGGGTGDMGEVSTDEFCMNNVKYDGQTQVIGVVDVPTDNEIEILHNDPFEVPLYYPQFECGKIYSLIIQLSNTTKGIRKYLFYPKCTRTQITDMYGQVGQSASCPHFCDEGTGFESNQWNMEEAAMDTREIRVYQAMRDVGTPINE